MATVAARPASLPCEGDLVLAQAGDSASGARTPWRPGRTRRPDRPCPGICSVVGGGEGDPVVARDGEADRLLAARRDVDQDQRVGGVAADPGLDARPAPGVQSVKNIVRKDVAVPVGPALQAHQQDVLRADGRAADDGVRAADAAHVAHDKVGKAAHREDQGRGHAAQGISGLPGGPPQRGRRAWPNHGIFPQQSQLWIDTVRRSLPSRSRYQCTTANIRSTYE